MSHLVTLLRELLTGDARKENSYSEHVYMSGD
jgi:hypothetical protein